jgi:UMF1 family MFS transporter
VLAYCSSVSLHSHARIDLCNRYADGLGTVGSAAAILFSQQVPGMSGTLVGAAIGCAYLTGAAGSLAFLWLQKRFRWNGKWILFGCVLTVGFVPLWAFFGLRTIPECFASAALYGLCLGSVYSQGRACFSRMVPKGLEAEFFSFYALTDKGSSWLGMISLGVFCCLECIVVCTVFS